MFLLSFSEKDDFLESMRQRSSKVSLYGIMTFTRRQGRHATRASARFFELDTHFAWDATPLELHVLDVQGALCLTVFTQGNVSASRKQVAHALIFLSDGLFSPIAPRRHVDASAPRTDVDAHISLWYVGSNSSQWTV